MEKYYKMSYAFFENEKYRVLTANERDMYCVLYARYEVLRRKKAFNDEDGAFIYYTVQDLMSYVGIGSNKTVVDGLKHLESLGLISRKKTDGKADKIYVNEPESFAKNKTTLSILYPNIENCLESAELEMLEKIVVSVMYKKRKSYIINHEAIPVEIIYDRLLMLDTGDVVRVFEKMRSYNIGNNFMYILTALWNSFKTDD